MIEGRPALRVQCLAFNGLASPFDELRVRQAVQHAVDKTGIAAAIFANRYVPGAGPLGPEIVGYDANLMA
jgi:peptide/nickel transport system substrate-binding protein